MTIKAIIALFFAKNDDNLESVFREKRRETITITIPFVSPYYEDLASFPFLAITVCYHLGAVSAHLLVNSLHASFQGDDYQVKKVKPNLARLKWKQ